MEAEHTLARAIIPLEKFIKKKEVLIHHYTHFEKENR